MAFELERLNLASNVAALIALALGGKVLWAIGLSMAVASIAGGQVGAHLAMRIGAASSGPCWSPCRCC